MSDLINEQTKAERLKVAKELEEVAGFLDLNSLHNLFPSIGDYEFEKVTFIEDCQGTDGLCNSVEDTIRIQYKGRFFERGSDLALEVVRFYTIIKNGSPIVISDAGRDLYNTENCKEDIIAIKEGDSYVAKRNWEKTKINYDVVLLRTFAKEFFWIKSSCIEQYTHKIMKEWFKAIQESEVYVNYIKSGKVPLYVDHPRFDLGFDVKVKKEPHDTKHVMLDGDRYKASISKIMCYLPSGIFKEGQVACPRKG